MLNCRLLSYFIFFMFMTSCSVGPPYTPPLIEVPSGWKNEQNEKCQGYETNENGELVYLDHWWQVFNDTKLDRLEDFAIENNRNLLAAYERIQEARAIMGIAAANFYPHITLNPSTTNIVELTKNYIDPSLVNTNANAISSSYINGNNQTISSTTALGVPFRAHEVLYFLPVNLSYEVDLWGKIKDQYCAATYSWLAQKKIMKLLC